MTTEGIYSLARNLWGVWLMAVFLAIAVWAFWPGRRRREEMRDHADIPFREGTDP